MSALLTKNNANSFKFVIFFPSPVANFRFFASFKAGALDVAALLMLVELF